MKFIDKSVLLISCLALGLMSSCDFLSVDKYFDDTLKYDSVFSNKRNLEKYLWGAAGELPDESKIFGNDATPGITAADDIFTLMDPGLFHGKALTLGQVSAADTKGLGVWGTCYKVIRKANLIMSRMNECKDITPLEKQELLGYAHFLRGYAYYHILMNYGPVIIIGDEPLDTNADAEYYDRARVTYDESVEYICSELEMAAKYISSDVPILNFGRPSKGAAYAIIARIRLQAASPAFNGGTAAYRYFGDWKRGTDGVQYISQTYDERKWAVAAAAARRVMEMDGGQRYTLHTVVALSNGAYITPPLPAGVPSDPFPNGAGGIDPLKSYTDMFNGETYPTQNKEFIWARNSGDVAEFTRQSFPINMGGYNGMCLTQKLIDAYKTRGGKTIQEAGPDEYSEEGQTKKVETFSAYRLNRDTYNMYANREMRFYACVGFSGCFWPATSSNSTDKKNVTVTYYKGGSAGMDAASGEDAKINYAVTGYVLKKYINPFDSWADGGTRVSKAFPIIRYAEILLSYAEAVNHLNSTHSITMESGETYQLSRAGNLQDMISAFNQIRYRAGLPGLRPQDYATEESMDKQIVIERLVEFLAEGRRFYDIRRWGIYEEEENKPIEGMNITGDQYDFYQRSVVTHADYRNRVVDRKTVFLPIPRDEMRKASQLDQNPGWDD
ncbi:RagB/SusD family nutrient uptake outer membrane protein [Bacteroides sp. K03]|uniref:RagB/SusD family nutrient uptake outer membrane protein n=1 Tax=unclassified Bacteroides TaxID=2646097 RepID=UPI001C8CDF51|nr:MULTISPECIES: RagB/SusD family nutrient uptake outer membrane protein [unclassified Bacteroides]MBX9189558.1 RagB/SusD family nutrient uptake outer membrane protein [Bacteroides sp. K03]